MNITDALLKLGASSTTGEEGVVSDATAPEATARAVSPSPSQASSTTPSDADLRQAARRERMAELRRLRDEKRQERELRREIDRLEARVGREEARRAHPELYGPTKRDLYVGEKRREAAKKAEENARKPHPLPQLPGASPETGVLTFRVKEVYGRTLYYPGCSLSQALVTIARVKSLTAKDVKLLMQVGYAVRQLPFHGLELETA